MANLQTLFGQEKIKIHMHNIPKCIMWEFSENYVIQGWIIMHCPSILLTFPSKHKHTLNKNKTKQKTTEFYDSIKLTVREYGVRDSICNTCYVKFYEY